MDTLSLITQNLLSPAVMFFVLGITAGFIKSDLKIPESISRYLSIYLMMAIGFKGGVAMAETGNINSQIIATIVGGMLIGLFQPFIAYKLLRCTTKLDSTTAAATAAHYGSISMVTFVTATSFLEVSNVIYAGYIVAILAMMEAPAIVSGLYIAHRANPKTLHSNEEKQLAREIFTNGAILLLFGAFIIGLVTGEPGLKKVEGFLVTPFQGVLCLFLLDMGLLAVRNLTHLKLFTPALAAFGIYMPLIGAIVGLTASKLIGLDTGTGTLFTVLCASASYIAVPAAMRLALPEAKAEIYLPLSLGITFPFNIAVGIPLYYAMAQAIL